MAHRWFSGAWSLCDARYAESLTWLCRGRESNPHAACATQDFKSCASASSATPASGWRPYRINDLRGCVVGIAVCACSGCPHVLSLSLNVRQRRPASIPRRTHMLDRGTASPRSICPETASPTVASKTTILLEACWWLLRRNADALAEVARHLAGNRRVHVTMKRRSAPPTLNRSCRPREWAEHSHSDPIAYGSPKQRCLSIG